MLKCAVTSGMFRIKYSTILSKRRFPEKSNKILDMWQFLHKLQQKSRDVEISNRREERKRQINKSNTSQSLPVYSGTPMHGEQHLSSRRGLSLFKLSYVFVFLLWNQNEKSVFTAGHGSNTALLMSKYQLDVTFTYMATRFIIHLHLGNWADAFVPPTYGCWLNGQNWKTRPVCHLCVHPGRWHASRVAYVCVTKQTLPFRSISYSAESTGIHACGRCMKMSFETEQPRSHACRPPCIPTQWAVSQSERGCQARRNEQRFVPGPDRSIWKRTHQALFWGLRPRMMNHLRGRWDVAFHGELGVGLPQMVFICSFEIFAGWRNVQLWLQRCWFIIILKCNLWCNM